MKFFSLTATLAAMMSMAVNAQLVNVDFDQFTTNGYAIQPSDFSQVSFTCAGNAAAPACQVYGFNTELKQSNEYSFTFGCPSYLKDIMIWFPGSDEVTATIEITLDGGAVTTISKTRLAGETELHNVSIELFNVVSVKISTPNVDDVFLCEFNYEYGSCSVGGGGGDPHFFRWQHDHRESFHGQCDLVMVHSDSFHGEGFDLHVRTTIDSFYSYIETAAVRIGGHVLEVDSKKIYLDGEKVDAPVTFKSTDNKHEYVYKVVNAESNKKFAVLEADKRGVVDFRFYKNYLTLSAKGTESDLSDAQGLLGNFKEGAMMDRDGNAFDRSFEEYAFEWQVNTLAGDPALFVHDRSPQLPYARCEMPTQARPARRLRADTALLKQAESACAGAVGNSNDFALCVDDVMATGELGLAEMW